MKLLGNLTNQDRTVFQTSSDNKAVTIMPPSTLTGASLTLTTPNIPTGTTDTLVSRTSTDTLTNKTFSGGTISALTNMAIRDTSAAFDVTIATTSSPILTAGRVLTLNVENGARTLNLGGDLTLAGAFTTAGAFPATFTFTGATNLTFPTSGTLASNSAATSAVAGIITTFVPAALAAIKTVTSADYTILTADGYHTILVSTGASNRTITLPAASANGGREIVVKKTDSGAGLVIVTRAGADTLDANTTRVLVNQYDSMRLGCDGVSNYPVIKHPNTVIFFDNSATSVTAQAAGTQKNIFGAASGKGVTLQPGTWNVQMQGQLSAVAGTAQPAGNGECGLHLSTTEDTGTGLTYGDIALMQDFKTNAQLAVGKRMINLSSIGSRLTVTTATTYYLNAYHGYAGTAPEWSGALIAMCVG